MSIDRRQALKTGGYMVLAASAAALGCRPPSGEDSEAPSLPVSLRERIAQIIREYDAQGVHRTGTDVDQASAEWLLGHLRAAGVDAKLYRLSFERLDIAQAFVEIDGARIEGIPLFDAPPTGPNGVEGVLGSVGDDSEIGFAEVGPTPGFSPDYFAQRQSTTQQAQLAVTGGERWGVPPGYSLINAEHYLHPAGPPTLQLPSESLEILQGARGKKARVVTESSRPEVPAYNVTASLLGSNPGLEPVVVMTPRSGWWNCASERGGGIALLVEIARALALDPPERNVHFVASTGHELGHVGLEHYLDRNSQWIQGARAWIHLGANFVAAKGREVRLQASDEELEQLALREMERAGAPPQTQTPVDERPLGEARNIFDGGGRYLSLLGRNGLFHHPDDRWPEAVDLDHAEKLAKAWVAIVQQLAAT